jgi:hypothetical protein
VTCRCSADVLFSLGVSLALPFRHVRSTCTSALRLLLRFSTAGIRKPAVAQSRNVEGRGTPTVTAPRHCKGSVALLVSGRANMDIRFVATPSRPAAIPCRRRAGHARSSKRPLWAGRSEGCPALCLVASGIARPSPCGSPARDPLEHGSRGLGNGLTRDYCRRIPASVGLRAIRQEVATCSHFWWGGFGRAGGAVTAASIPYLLSCLQRRSANRAGAAV